MSSSLGLGALRVATHVQARESQAHREGARWGSRFYRGGPLQEPRASKEMDDGEDSGCEAILHSANTAHFALLAPSFCGSQNRVIFNLRQAPFLEPRIDFVA